MNCEYHKNLDASHICSDCGVSICKDCAVNHNGKILCIECVKRSGLPIIKNLANENNGNNYSSNGHNNSNQNANSHNSNSFNENRVNHYSSSSPKKYSSFWSTVFSFLPGGGHMYIGLMKRGLQFMLIFFGIIALSSFFYSADFLVFFAAVVWFYSFFDCYHMRKKLERSENIDEDLIFPVDIKSIDGKHFGTGLIVLGGLVLLNEFLDQIVYITNRMNINSENLRVAIRLIRDSVFPVVLIIIGFLILKKTKKSAEE
ncbi:MAG: B-box zinc finger protein [Tissierellales bacterium]